MTRGIFSVRLFIVDPGWLTEFESGIMLTNQRPRDSRTDDALNLRLAHWHSLPPCYRAWGLSVLLLPGPRPELISDHPSLFSHLCDDNDSDTSTRQTRHSMVSPFQLMYVRDLTDKLKLQVQIFYLLVLNGKSFFQKICWIEASISPPQVQIKVFAFQVGKAISKDWYEKHFYVWSWTQSSFL